jgi:hypothetical protein
MRLPAIHGVIDRRILINYRVDPEMLARQLPRPFRPQIVRGYGLAGICLIRLRGVRPGFTPRWLGLSSENAAHRAAVEWDEGESVKGGVFVRRRDTSSRLNSLAGGRLFPGIQYHAQFEVQETSDRFQLDMRSDDGQTSLALDAELTDAWSGDSIFATLDEASAFFQAGSLGYSSTPNPRRFQGMELCCESWRVEPLAVGSVRSSQYDNPALFPPGSAQLDCALLMRGIEHQWQGRKDLCCGAQRESELVGSS